MQLIMTWPDTKSSFLLKDSFTFEQAACFNVCTGTFGHYSVAQNRNLAFFYCAAVGHVMFNGCEDAVCLIDGVEQKYGQISPLKFGTEIQLGHYMFVVATNNDADISTELIYSLLDVTTEGQKANLLIPEIEDILPSGGHHTGDLRYFNDEVSLPETDADVLKKLETEYKKFLIWGEQNSKFYEDNPGKNINLSSEEEAFYSARDAMKTRTLTECIISTPYMIDKVWQELETISTHDDLLCEEENHDILRSLAPENISNREKKKLPEIVFHDIYKTGLDSHY